MSVVVLIASIGTAQIENRKTIPSVTTVPIEDGAVTVLHLGPGYTTSVRVPDEISSVVIGNPATFKAEHSEAEPRLVFFKPITAQACESNALITTKSGQEIPLHLVSGGKANTNARVDFLVEYRRPSALLIDTDRQSFVISETRPVSPVIAIEVPPARIGQPDLIAKALEEQKAWSSPAWIGRELLAAVGKSIQQNSQTILGFSTLNRSKSVIELLPPQLELSGTRGGGKKKIKAEPVPIAEYRITARRLEPGQRADGVVVFERPAFKESREDPELRLALAEQVDRPILLPVGFTASREAGAQ